jgi:hypothetical protein
MPAQAGIQAIETLVPACAGVTMSELIRGSLEICGRGLLMQAGRILEHNQARCAYKNV